MKKTKLQSDRKHTVQRLHIQIKATSANSEKCLFVNNGFTCNIKVLVDFITMFL